MDLLETGVAEVALLMATARALRAPMALKPDSPSELRGRRRMRNELRRAAAAYLKALLRSEGAMAESDVLAASRVAAEGRMPTSISQRHALRSLMTDEPGVLDGFVAERHDLWRLARLAIALRHVAVGEAKDPESKAQRKSAKQLGKRLRKALVGYVRAGAQADGIDAPWLTAARQAALDELGFGRDAATDAGIELVSSAERSGSEAVGHRLRDLLADWASD